MLVLLLLLQTAGGEEGPGHPEGYHAWRGTGDEDVFITQAKIKRAAGFGEDITNAESGGGAIILFVDFGTIRIKEWGAVGVGFLDICGADGIAGEGFDIETGAGSIERMAVAYEEGYEDEVGLFRSKIVETYFHADLIAFPGGEAAVKKDA
jgi:hypothetical protein